MPVRVLIVEDEPLIRMLIRDLLEEEGFDCADCASAEDALTLLGNGDDWTPDVLVTDLNLGPGMDGLTLARETSGRLPGLAVIYVTANAACLASRPVGVQERILAKPFDPMRLAAAVRDLGTTPALGCGSMAGAPSHCLPV
jgi:CheY-like chemotaxis protein